MLRSLAEPHLVSALVRKRAQLVGDIELAREALRKMVLDLETVDATLLLFDSAYRVESINPKAFRHDDKARWCGATGPTRKGQCGARKGLAVCTLELAR